MALATIGRLYFHPSSGRKGLFFIIVFAAVMNAMLHRRCVVAFTHCHRHRHINSFIKQQQSASFMESNHFTTMKSNYNVRAATGGYSLDLCIPTAEDMEDVGGLLSVDSTKGDIILLDGDLGAGKTCFSRGFIRGRTGLGDERVTSPTYLLSNTYSIDGGECKIYHMDLYRLSGEDDDLSPLDLDNVFTNGISLIEWPSRLSKKPPEYLDITLTIESAIQDDGEDEYDSDSKSRCMNLVAHGGRWEERLKFLESEGYFEDLLIDASMSESS